MDGTCSSWPQKARKPRANLESHAARNSGGRAPVTAELVGPLKSWQENLRPVLEKLL
jgi:hypothetical protein